MLQTKKLFGSRWHPIPSKFGMVTEEGHTIFAATDFSDPIISEIWKGRTEQSKSDTRACPADSPIGTVINNNNIITTKTR